MNRKELIRAISDNSNVTLTEAQRFLDVFEEIVRTTLASGGEISLVGFGRFHRKKRSARIGRNPHTGEQMAIEAAYLPAFSPGKGLKETLNPAARS